MISVLGHQGILKVSSIQILATKTTCTNIFKLDTSFLVLIFWTTMDLRCKFLLDKLELLCWVLLLSGFAFGVHDSAVAKESFGGFLGNSTYLHSTKSQHRQLWPKVWLRCCISFPLEASASWATIGNAVLLTLLTNFTFKLAKALLQAVHDDNINL